MKIYAERENWSACLNSEKFINESIKIEIKNY